jgi:hypothetical protein
VLKHLRERVERHVFENLGHQHQTPLCLNAVSLSSSSTNILTSEEKCERPNIQLKTGGAKLISFQYQSDISIFSSVTIDCASSIKVVFQWEVYQSTTWEMEKDIGSDGKSALRLGTSMKGETSNLEIKLCV